VRSYMQKWKHRQADVRQQRVLMRALNGVSAKTVQDEIRAIAQAQLGR
jgi:hypothetical protein